MKNGERAVIEGGCGQRDRYTNELLIGHLCGCPTHRRISDDTRDSLRALVCPKVDGPLVMKDIEAFRIALQRRRIVPAFQLYRRFDGADAKGNPCLTPVASGEVLPRLLDDDGEVLPTGAFLQAAHAAGLMTQLNEELARQAFSHLRTVNDDPRSPDFTFSLNVHQSWLQTFDCKRFQDIMREEGVWWPSIGLEVLETIPDVTPHIETLKEATRRGAQLYMDDFGKGNSSVNTLTLKDAGVPIHGIKVPGQDVEDMRDPLNGQNIRDAVGAAVDVGAKTIVVEGLPGGLDPQFLVRACGVIDRSLDSAGASERINVLVQGPLRTEIALVDELFTEEEPVEARN